MTDSMKLRRYGPRRTLTGALTAFMFVALAACSGAGDNPADRNDLPAFASGDQARVGTAPDSALRDIDNPDFPDPLIDTSKVISGGPPPDGIPPLDAPTFEVAADVDWLEPQEPVLSLTVDAETRAYPLRVMTWHEIVNDTVAGVPLAVTYCPLCNSGVAFEREVDGEVLSFGTSGLLFQDNLVMYDRASESLWPQLTGEASIGVRTGEQLVAIPLGTVPWSEFLAAHPEAKVLSQETGFDRPYGKNPYVGYDEADGNLIFEPTDELDARLLPKERVIGLSGDNSNVAVLRSALVGTDPLVVDLAGQDVVMWHEPGQNSALDAASITDGRDVGTVGVFDPQLDGQQLTFERAGDAIIDAQTQSTWNVLGIATSGELAGQRLQTVTHLDTFWFSWVLFHPETTLMSN